MGASSVSAATDVSGAAVGVPTSSHRQRRHLRAAAAAAHHKRAGRGLDDATEALEAAEEAEEEEEEAEPVDEPTELGWTDLELTQLNEEDEEGRDTIPEAPAEEERDTIPEVPAEDEDLTPEEEAAAAELVGESKSTGDDVAEVVAEEAAPAEVETEDEAPADTDTTEEEESPAMGGTEETSEEPTLYENEDTAATATEEDAPMDEEILDELVNEEDELPEDVVQELNDEIEDILDAVNAVTSGEPTPMGDGSDALDEDTEQQWTPVGAPTVEDPEPVPAPTVDYGNDAEEGPAPTVDYFDFQYRPNLPSRTTRPMKSMILWMGLMPRWRRAAATEALAMNPSKVPSRMDRGRTRPTRRLTTGSTAPTGRRTWPKWPATSASRWPSASCWGWALPSPFITASCALNNPDGLCAGCCRLILTLFHCICHVLCLPCRVCCGCGSKREDARQGATLVGRSDLEFS